MRLERGERLRAIYRPNNHGPVNPDPRGFIEQFQTIAKALEVFEQRILNGSSRFYEAGVFKSPQIRDWPGADETGYLDVWVETPRPGEEPMPPDCFWQRWTWVDGAVQRDNF